MRTGPELTAELIRRLITFDGERYYWLPRPREMFSTNSAYGRWNNLFAGKEALTARGSNGYLSSGILGRYYPTHRVIWLYHYGEWPNGLIDHVNGNRSDNRLENLRVVDFSGNAQNRSINSNNRSGVSGIHWNKISKKWQAKIIVNKRHVYLGQFSSLEAAKAARKKAELDHGFHENHGRAR